MNKSTLSKFSQIGQGISGTLGTVISFLGFLVIAGTLILQYVESVKNNNNLRTSREVARLETMLASVKSDLDNCNLTYIRKGKPIPIKGTDALMYFAESFDAAKDHTEILDSPFFQNIYFATGTVDIFLDRLEAAKLSETERKYLITTLCYAYSSRLTRPLAIVEHVIATKRLKIDKDHKDLEKMLGAVIQLNQRMYKITLKENV